MTSNEVVTLTTNESGFTEAIKIPKNAGTYTCKEVMTTAQARKYRIVSVNPQTITAPEGESAVCFMKQYYQSRNSEWKLEPVIYAKTVKQIQCYRFFQDNR